MQSFELGTYFIKVTSEQNNKTNTYKIIKMKRLLTFNFFNIPANVCATARCHYQATIRGRIWRFISQHYVTFKVTIYEGQGR